LMILFFSNFFLNPQNSWSVMSIAQCIRWFLFISNFLFLKKSILSTKLGLYFGMH
jgi:hypothetical protein